MKKLLLTIIAATAGLWLATIFVPGIQVQALADSNFFGLPLTEPWQIFLMLGIILGLLNYLVKPVLNVITLPLQIITLGFFSFVISVALVWAVDFLFEEMYISLWLPLIYTTLIIWGLSIVLTLLLDTEK